MNIVIVGAGEVGFSVARNLSQDGHDVVLIENEPERASKAENELDVMVVRGNGSRPGVLAKAGVVEGTNVELLIACSARDEVNILACLIAKRMGVKRLISRAIGMEFTEGDTWSRDLGIGVMISPERSVAREIVALLETQGAVFSNEIDDKAGVYAFRVEEGAPACGLDLIQLRQKNPGLITIIVYIKRGQDGFIPKASDALQPGDICYSFCYVEQIHEIAQMYRRDKRRKLRRVFVVGGGKIGAQISQQILLRRPNIDLKVFDLDLDKCGRIASELPSAMAIWGDGADDDLLRNEGIDQCDGFVAATDDDEKNLIMASLGRTLGAQKSIAVIRRRSYMKLAPSLPIDAIVNRNETLSSVILSTVRHPEHASTLTIFDQLGAETLQVTITESSPAIGVALKDLTLPKGALVGLVRREGIKKGLIIPTGMFEFMAGDKAIIFSAQEAVDDVLACLGASEA